MKNSPTPSVMSAVAPPDAENATPDREVPEKRVHPRSGMGRFGPGIFPDALVVPVTRAIDLRDGPAVMALLMGDATGYYWQAWNRRNPTLLAEHLPKAFLEPVATLTRMIAAGEVPTVPDLQIRIEQVLARTGWKYAAKAYKKSNPKLGRGRRNRYAREGDVQPGLIVSGLPRLVDAEDGGPQPDEAARTSELRAAFDRTRASLEPLAVRIFDAVQEYRSQHGISGAVPAVARRLVVDEQGIPVALGDDDKSGDDAPIAALGPDALKLLLGCVRRAYRQVRQALAAAVIGCGHAVPEFRKRSRKRKSPRPPSAGERSLAE